MKSLILKLMFLPLFFLFCNATEIKVGMSADFTKSVSYIGENMKKGIETYFYKHNKNSKNQYKLISYDDNYNPILASKYTKRLIFDDKVNAILGSVGTPTANVVLPIIKENKIPFIGAYSGGNILRNKENKYVFNFRASYTQESYAITKKLLSLGLSVKDIAVFSQNDTYGDSGYFGVLKAILEEKNVSSSSLAHERYTKDTLNIELGLSKLLDWNNDFKAIIIVGVNKATAKFIEYAKEDFPNAKFFLLSPINVKQIVKELPSFKDDIYSTQILPALSNKNKLKLIDEFKVDYENKFGLKDYNLISFEGYLVAKLFILSIEKDGIDISRDSIYKALSDLRDFDIGLGFKSDFNNMNSQYSNKVWISKVNDNFELVSISGDDIFRR